MDCVVVCQALFTEVLGVEVTVTMYTGYVTFVLTFSDHKTGQVAVEDTKEAERLPWSFKGGTEDIQTWPWTPWSPWSFEHVQNSRTKVAEEVDRSHVTQGGGWRH